MYFHKKTWHFASQNFLEIKFIGFFTQPSCKTGFVTVNFTKANIGRLEPLILAMFCVYQNLQAVPAPRKRVWARVQGGLRSFRGRSHSVVHYSGTKCHGVIGIIQSIDNLVTLSTAVGHNGVRTSAERTWDHLAPLLKHVCVGQGLPVGSDIRKTLQV